VSSMENNLGTWDREVSVKAGVTGRTLTGQHVWPIKDIRPILNLSAVSKVLKRLVLTRLRPRLLGSANISQFRSAYRKAHSTKIGDYSGKVKNHRSLILTARPVAAR